MLKHRISAATNNIKTKPMEIVDNCPDWSVNQHMHGSLCWLYSGISRTVWSNSASSWTSNWIISFNAFQERLTRIWTCSSNLIMSLAVWSSVVSTAACSSLPAVALQPTWSNYSKRCNYRRPQRLVSSKQAWSAELLSMTARDAFHAVHSARDAFHAVH